MKKAAAILFLFCGIPALMPAVPGAAQVKGYKTIIFQGLEHLSKYEIIEGVPMKRQKGTILLDTDVLKKHLAAMRTVKSFSLKEEKRGLVVEISERKARYTLAVKNRKKLVFLEVDENYKIIARGRLLGGTGPVIFCRRTDLDEGRFSTRVTAAMKRLAWLRGERKTLYRELESLSFVAGGKLALTLKGRPTRFITGSAEVDFRRLEAVAGYCDREKKYPDIVMIEGSRVVVR